MTVSAQVYHWTDEDRERVFELANAGLSNTEIGKALNRTPSAIMTIVHQLRRAGRVIKHRKNHPVGETQYYSTEGRPGAERLARQIQNYWHGKGRKDVFCVAQVDGGRWTVRSNIVAGLPVASVRR